MTDDDLCPMSDLPPDQCALACHRNEHLPSGLAPDEEPVRGDIPSGVSVWPPTKTRARLETVAAVVTVDPLGARSATLIGQRRRRRPKDTSNCRYEGVLDQWCTAEHVRDCTSNACQGCKPCDKAHCGHRGRCPNHVNAAVGERTCAQCIGRVRLQIAQIVDDTTLISAELEHAGVEEPHRSGKTAPDVTEPANLAGPAASPEQVLGQLALDDDRGWCALPRRGDVYDGLDPHHPYAILGRWEFRFRNLSGAPQSATFTNITRAANYLTRLLDTRMPHDDQVFDPFAKDVSACHDWLQEVLHNSRRPETGAPCPKCSDDLRGTTTPAPRLERRFDNGDRTGANDTWVCPNVPTHRWKEADYRIRVGGDYLALSEKLTADQLRKQYGITPGTIRKWAERGQVRKRGRDAHGRMLYDVRDARRREDDRRGWCDYPRVVDVYPHHIQEASA